jgi:HAE1 family hydrophobic/amphiphilic exporter-1
VKEKLQELAEFMPPSIDYKVSYDVSTFLDASIEQVLHTLRDAFILVAFVVFIFLGDWRSTLIPIIAVPVSMIGTFFIMQLFDLSINLITLFALVLSIGIVVDNAIVVVEAVHAKMEGIHHLAPYNCGERGDGRDRRCHHRDHAHDGLGVHSDLIHDRSGRCVLSPVLHHHGGRDHYQSAVVALTLTPVLCAMMLKPHDAGMWGSRIDHGSLHRWFNRWFERIDRSLCGKVLDRMVARRTLTFGALLVFCAGIYLSGRVLPAGFIPSEDQGTIYAIIQTPPGSTLETTNKVAHELQQICEEIPEVESVSSLAGYEIMTEGRGSNAGTCLIDLKPWHDRDKDVNEVMEELEEKTKDIGARSSSTSNHRRCRASAHREGFRCACWTRRTGRTTTSSSGSTTSSWPLGRA